MKRILSLVLLLALSLSSLLMFNSCAEKPEEPDNTTVNVAMLTGSTGLGIAKLYDDVKSGAKEANYNMTFLPSPSAVTASLTAGEIDIAALSTTTAAAYFNGFGSGTAEIEVLAINTLGVLYLLDNGHGIQSFADLKGKTVYLPTENDAPTYIFRALLAQNGLVEGDGADEVNLAFAANPAALRTDVIAGDVTLAVLPEPLVSAVLMNNKDVSIALDLTEEWGEETPVAQGCIVVRRAFLEAHPTAVDAFMADYAESIAFMTNPDNIDTAAEAVLSTELLTALPLAKAVIPRANMVCLTGEEMKNTLSSFLSAMYEVAPEAIGGKMPSDAFYHE